MSGQEQRKGGDTEKKASLNINSRWRLAGHKLMASLVLDPFLKSLRIRLTYVGFTDREDFLFRL